MIGAAKAALSLSAAIILRYLIATFPTFNISFRRGLIPKVALGDGLELDGKFIAYRLTILTRDGDIQDYQSSKCQI
jgi:hypothetical protein